MRSYILQAAHEVHIILLRLNLRPAMAYSISSPYADEDVASESSWSGEDRGEDLKGQATKQNWERGKEIKGRCVLGETPYTSGR